MFHCKCILIVVEVKSWVAIWASSWQMLHLEYGGKRSHEHHASILEYKIFRWHTKSEKYISVISYEFEKIFHTKILKTAINIGIHVFTSFNYACQTNPCCTTAQSRP